MKTENPLDFFRQLADPPADEAITLLIESDGLDATRKLFEQLIDRVELPIDELPAGIRTFVNNHSELPDWVDPVLLERSERLFIDHGPKFLLFLYFKSLPTLYACANGAEVLARTGRLNSGLEGLDKFSRRIAETGQFVLEVTAPASLAPGGSAIDTILRIRLIHAAIRHFIALEEWDAAFGRPINQEDMAITMLTFCVSMLDGLRTFGLDETEENEEAYVHRWKVIGFLLGLDERLQPADVAAGRELLSIILNRQAAESDAGRLLGAALIDFVEKAFGKALVFRSAEGFVRYLNDDRITDALQFEGGRGMIPWLIPRAAALWFRFVERLEEASPALARVIDFFIPPNCSTTRGLLR